MNHKFLTMIGLCTRAGRCVFGETGCLSAVRSGKAKLMLLHGGCSENTKKRFSDACRTHQVPFITTIESIDDAAGKPGRKLIAVTDVDFAAAIQKAYEQSSTFTGGSKDEQT